MMGFHLMSQGEELTVVVSPETLSKTGANGNLTSNTATATPSGGATPYTFLWTRVSGSVFTINTPTNSQTTFTGNGTDEAKGGRYRCTVTDDNTNTVSDTVQVNFIFGTPQ